MLGRVGESDPRVRIRVQVLLTASIVIANVVGAIVVSVVVAVVVTGLGSPETATIVAVPVYVAGAVVVGVLWGTRLGVRRLQWAFEGREPTVAEQRTTLRIPLRLFTLQAVLWIAAVPIFSTLESGGSFGRALRIALVVGLGGIVTCAVAYLLSEFALRPIAARALSTRVPDRLLVPGVTVRSVLAWALGSAVPVAGIMLAAVFSLADTADNDTELAVTILVLGGITLVVGLLLVALAIRATVDPIQSVRAGMGEVESGRYDVEVPVYDGTEVGLLQAGFNRMAAGLRERERIRDLFGRHVGEDVARDALERNIELGGEVRVVAVLFVDIIGSTAVAAQLPPTEVVRLLNRFFGIVVDVVDAHGGMVNKFIGDAALAVFGAPTESPDASACALRAARLMARRLAAEVPELPAGIGVAAGDAVAGNVGDERRFEYTVIGDPVNEAARLTELAKTTPHRAVASWKAVRRAEPDEAACWEQGETVTLRGRSEATVLAHPVTLD